MGRVNQNFAPKLPPLSHQVEAIKYVSENTNVALFDQQGLGKTKIVIDALCNAMKLNEIDAVLVVAPLSLVFVWEQELAKHSHLVPMVLRGSERDKRYRLLTGANFYIINYEAVVAGLDTIRRFCKSRRMALVLDEAARIKNPSTMTARALFEIAPIAKKRIIVTGTPVANKPLDVWAQFFFLDRGQLLGDDFARFRAEYDENCLDYAQKLATLRKLVASNSIRRLKENTLKLPEKAYEDIVVEISKRQLELYTQLREELRIEITNMEGSKVVDEAENILKKLLRLTQIASNPGLVDTGYTETPAKFPVLEQLVSDLVADGEKVVIWSSFVENILVLKSMLQRFHPLVIHGAVPGEDRALFVTRFQESDQFKILIANPAAAREGLTLTRASKAVYLDRNFNLVDYLQSQDRIHRISQTKRCTIYKMIAKGTIDEYIDTIMEFKAGVAAFVQGDRQEIEGDALDILGNKHGMLQMLGG